MTSNPAHTDLPDSTTPTDRNDRQRTGVLRKALIGTAVAAVTVPAVGGAAVAVDRHKPTDSAAAALAAAVADRTPGVLDLGERGSTTSRSLSAPVDPAKAALVMRATHNGGQVTKTVKIDPVQAAAASGDPKSIARAMLGQFGFGSDQFSCLDSLWEKESGWDPHASNGSSGAYGIPQSLPGSKMASAGSDWQSNPATQIEWGLGYIRDTYGSPCSAWGHSEANGWY